MKAPQFQLQKVYADGNAEEPQLYEINGSGYLVNDRSIFLQENRSYMMMGR